MNILKRAIKELRVCKGKTEKQVLLMLWQCMPCAKRLMGLLAEDGLIQNKLKTIGAESTVEQRRAIMTYAWICGRSGDELSRAVIEASQGEFERLKEFGIRMKRDENTFIASFQGKEMAMGGTCMSILTYIQTLNTQLGLPELPPHYGG